MNTETALSLKKAAKRRALRHWLPTALLGVSALALCFAMLMLGSTAYSVREVFAALFGNSLKGAGFAVKYVRWPRLLACLFAGFAFGAAGNVFQVMLRNPLANPNVVGVTSGSSAAAVFCILILHAGQAATSAAAVLGGLGTVAVIFLLTLRKSYSPGRLILVGIGIQAALNALISYMLLIGAENDIQGTLRWLSGSTNAVGLSQTLPLIVCVAVLVPVVLTYGKRLGLLQLGEQTAMSLGVKTGQTRIVLSVSAVCLTAFAVAATGPIAFISFLSGPISKRLVGFERPGTVAAGFVGADLVLGADLIGQFAFPLKYPVGVITGILGAPYLIFLLIKMNRKGTLQ
jgi:iron complex transport system permease protein